MKALETFAIYVTPFLVLGLAARLLLQRYVVDLADLQKLDLSESHGGFSYWAAGAPSHALVAHRGRCHRRRPPRRTIGFYRHGVDLKGVRRWNRMPYG